MTFCRITTALVVIVKLAEVWPAGIVTDGGTWQLELLEASDTVTPPEGAGALKLTTPVSEPPPVTDRADSDSPFSETDTMALIVRLAEAELPLALAVIVAFTGALTLEVVMVKLAEVWPAGIVTDGGN